jgi:hypothetical protein
VLQECKEYKEKMVLRDLPARLVLLVLLGYKEKMVLRDLPVRQVPRDPLVQQVR